MRALGLVNRTVREINEMRYEFDEPFIVDASRAETELGLRATPLRDAVDQTVRWYREQASVVMSHGSPQPLPSRIGPVA
jgi:nucleoside-diphosphate-sugar epimerase